MSQDRRERDAVARWRPGRRWYHPLLARLVIGISKFVTTGMNTLTIEGLERLAGRPPGRGKGVPIVRGAGIEQPGFHFLRDRLAEGEWVQIFPEGGRTRDPQALMAESFKSGIGRLMAEARPVILPFYHYGMHEVLPVGAKLPRRGRTVRLVFGEPVDCDDAYLRQAAERAGDPDLQGPPLW